MRLNSVIISKYNALPGRHPKFENFRSYPVFDSRLGLTPVSGGAIPVFGVQPEPGRGGLMGI